MWTRAARIVATAAIGVGLFGTAVPAAPDASSAAGQANGDEHEISCDVGPSPALPVLCVHGEDPPPAGADVDERRSAEELAADTATSLDVAAAASTTSCVGDGIGGKRVQALYVVASDKANRASQIVPLIRQWAALTESSFVDSAAQTGGVRRVRWVHDSVCVLDVDTVVVAANADDSFGATITAIQNAGYTSPSRKYLMWVDANVYCGIAQLYPHTAKTNNLNNGSYAMYSRVDNGCWGYSTPSVEAHELMHNLGAVQSNSPNHSPYGHCLDDKDTMCYADGPGVVVATVCPGTENERLFDCNKDDYFNTAPPTNSYLATNWNTADSAFLFDGPHAPTPPDPDPDPDPDPPATTEVRDTTASWYGTLAVTTIARSVTPSADGAFSVRLRFTGSKPMRLRVYRDGVLLSDVKSGAGLITYAGTAVDGERLKFSVSGTPGAKWVLRTTYPITVEV